MNQASISSTKGDPPRKGSGLFAWLCTLGSAALCFMAFIGLSELSNRYAAPRCAAVSTGSVWVYGQGTLWLMTHRGDVTDSYSSKDLGVGPLLDRLTALDESRLIVADGGSGEWRYCRAGDHGMVEARCEPLFGGAEAARNRHRASVAAAPEGERWVFADFQAGDILLMSSERRVLAKGRGFTAREGGAAVWLPDRRLGLIESEKHALWVASLEGDRIAPLEERWSLKSGGKPISGYVWWAAFDASRRKWWLTHSSGCAGSLLQTDDAGEMSKSLTLDAQGRPGQLALLDRDHALVPDEATGRVHRLDLANGRMEDFGDERFRSEIEHGQRRYDELTRAAKGAAGGIIALPLAIGIFFVRRDSNREWIRRRSALESATGSPTAASAAANVKGAFWFTINPKRAPYSRRHMRRTFWFLELLEPGSAVLIGQALNHFASVSNKTVYFPLVAGGLVMALMMRRVFIRMVEKAPTPRLGTSNGFVLYDDGGGQIEEYPFESVLTNGKSVLVGRHAVALGSPGIPSMWDAEELRARLESRLPLDNRVSSWRFARELQKRARDVRDQLPPPPATIDGEFRLTPRPLRAETVGLLIAMSWPYIVVAISVLPAFVLEKPRYADNLFYIVSAAVALVASLALIAWGRAAKKAATRKLWVREGVVLHDPGSGRMEEHPMETVLTDGARLLIGRHQLPLTPKSLFPAWNWAELHAYIASRLPARCRVSRRRFRLEAVRRNPRRTAIVAALAVLVVMGAWLC